MGLQRYAKLTSPGTKHLKAYPSPQPFWGVERRLLVIFSPTLYATRQATTNGHQRQAHTKLQKLAAAIKRWHETRQGEGYLRSSVEMKIARWIARESLRLSLACHRRQGGQWETRWHQLVIWHPERMELFPARLARKGQRIKVQGTFQRFTFTGEDGEERELERFIVTRYQRLRRKGP